jgi:hypothetical protein
MKGLLETVPIHLRARAMFLVRDKRLGDFILFCEQWGAMPVK